MTAGGHSQQRIDAYLGRLRRRLRGINDEDARDIVEELRSHITDKASASGELCPSGIVDSGMAGLILGAAYVLSGRNLCVCILADGFMIPSEWSPHFSDGHHKRCSEVQSE